MQNLLSIIFIIVESKLILIYLKASRHLWLANKATMSKSTKYKTFEIKSLYDIHQKQDTFIDNHRRV